EARLAAFRVGLQEIDDLDAGFEHLDPRRLLVERRRRAMDRVRLLGVDGGPLVDGLADDVEDAAERFFADRNRDRRAGVQHAHASAPCLSASAPPTMSSSSLVIFSWRALLYWMVRMSIISFAFLVAASMAVMRAPYSPASDSMSARNTCIRTWRGKRSARIAGALGS